MPNHALLSASSSHRWLNCPPSARLCEGYDDKGSDFAAEGTDAHALCEYKLRKALGMEAKDPTEDLTWYNSEMEECANGYVSFVMELVEEAKKTCTDPVVLIEQRLNYSKYVEEGFGTGDCVIIADGTLHIVDYKHGRGVLVEADDNPQMKLYALGALELFDCIYDIDTVSMTIYQPRRSNVSTFTIPKDELIEECIKENAHVALDQAEYQKRYDGLVSRFDKAKARHTEVTDLIAERMARKHQIESYLIELRNREPLTEFRETDWLAMVDYITVHSKKDIRVTFKDGTEIKA